MSKLLETIEGSAKELVRRAPDEEESGGSSPAGSPLDRLLDRLVPGEPPDDDFGRALQYGAVGSCLGIGGAFLLLLLPDGEDIANSGFLLVGKRTVGHLVDGMGSIAVPLLILAVLLLATTGVLGLIGRRVSLTGPVCVAQPAVGVVSLGTAGLAWAGIVLVFVITLVIWALIIAAALAILGAMASG